MDKPSILFVFTDQMRRDCLSRCGHSTVQTPNLDALSMDGVLFQNTVTQSPLCVPARMSLLSGRYVHQHGCTSNQQSLWPDAANFVRAIRDAGYDAAVRGKLHLFWRRDIELLMADPLHRAFGFTDAVETTGKCSEGRLRASAYTEHLKSKGLLRVFWRDLLERIESRRCGVSYGPSILSEEDQMDGWIMDQGREFIRNHANARKPWLLWVGPEGPHDPFDPPGKWGTMYDPEDIDPGLRQFSEEPAARRKAESMNVRQASDREIQVMRANYYGNISFIDHKVGELVGELKRSGHYDDTWIIFSSDHGEMLGDFHLTTKQQFHWQAVNVPLIIKPPSSYTNCPRGEMSKALVELIDVGTTMRAIADGRLEHDEGKSLLPILKGEAPIDHHRTSAHSQVGDRHMLQTESFKMMFQRDAATGSISPSSFYCLRDDPAELRNRLAEHSAAAESFIQQNVLPFFEATSANTMVAPKAATTPWQGRLGDYPYFYYRP